VYILANNFIIHFLKPFYKICIFVEILKKHKKRKENLLNKLSF
jgi:hypothetical protein